MWLQIELGHVGSIKDLMRKIPHREYLMHMARRKDQWNRPDRSDYYVMALMNVVQGLFGKMESDLDPFRVNFASDSERPDPAVKSQDYIEQRIAEAKARAAMPLKRGPRPHEEEW